MPDGTLNVGTVVNLSSLKEGFAEAKVVVKEASDRMAEAQAAFGKAAADGNQKAQAALKQYEEELKAAQAAQQKWFSALNEAQAAAQRHAQAMARLRLATEQASLANRELISSQQSVVSATRAANGELRLLEGNLQGSTRAASSLLASLPGISAAMQVAFPVFGAVALVGVLGQAYEGVQHLIQAFRDLSGAELNAETDAIAAGDKIRKIKAEEGLTGGIARFLSGAPQAQDLSLTQAGPQLQEIDRKTRIAELEDRIAEQGLKGVALQRQRVADAAKEIADLEAAQKAAQGIADAYKAQAEATIVIKDQGIHRGPRAPDQIVEKYTPTEIKAIQQQLAEATQAAKRFGEQIEEAKIGLKGLQEFKLPRMEDAADTKQIAADTKLHWKMVDSINAVADSQLKLNEQEAEYIGKLREGEDLTRDGGAMRDLELQARDLVKQLHEQQEAAKAALDQQSRSASDQYRGVEQSTSGAVSDGTMDPKQRIALLQQAAEEEYKIQQEALKKKEQLDAGDVVAYQKDLDAMTELQQQYKLKQAQLAQQATQQMLLPYKNFFQQLDQSFTQLVNNWLTGTGRMSANFIRFGDEMAIKWIDSLIKMELKSLQTWATQVAANQTKNTAIVASDAAASAQTQGISLLTALKQITHNAAVAATGAAAAVANIPIVGPVLAPVVGAATFVAVEALAAFDKGSNYVPMDGMAMLHKGETIIPASQQGPAYKPGQGGGDTHFHYAPQVSAIDGPSVASTLQKHGQAFAREQYRQLRLMNLVQ